MRRIGRKLKLSVTRPRSIEVAFVVVLLAAVLLYLPLRMAWRPALEESSPGTIALAPPAPGATCDVDIDPACELWIPSTPPGPPESRNEPEGRNLFAYGTPTPRPRVSRTPPPARSASTPAGPPVSPTPPPPPRWEIDVKLIGLFGYRDDPVAAFKDPDSEAIYVARMTEVVELKQDDKVKGAFRVAKIALDKVELEKPDDPTRKKTLTLSE